MSDLPATPDERLTAIERRLDALESDSSDTTDDLDRRVTAIEGQLNPADEDREDPREVGYPPAPAVTMEEELVALLGYLDVDEAGWTRSVGFHRTPAGVMACVGVHMHEAATAREALALLARAVRDANGNLYPGVPEYGGP